MGVPEDIAALEERVKYLETTLINKHRQNLIKQLSESLYPKGVPNCDCKTCTAKRGESK